MRLLPAPTPLQVREYRCASAPTRELMILLPGIGDVAEDYESHGFVDAVLRSEAPADLAAVDVHVGYYARRTVLERLRKDVIAPAREAGYEKIWLVGISLGGLGASLYAAEHAADLQGLVLLAPFLGDPRIVREIAGAGGLGAWQPDERTEGDYQRRLWQWAKRYSKGSEKLPALFLGYGEGDPFAPANRLLAQALPVECVLTVPGGHDWRTWHRLWRAFLGARNRTLAPRVR
jgi:pimeloyl-ACP methyl ester carboxylesterase